MSQNSNYQNLSILNQANHRQNQAKARRSRYSSSSSPSAHKKSTYSGGSPASTTSGGSSSSTPSTLSYKGSSRKRGSIGSSSGAGGSSGGSSVVVVGGGPSVSGDSSLIFILMIILLFLAFWKTIVVPVASLSWNTNSKEDITKLPWKGFLVGFFFVGIVTFISSINNTAYKLMIMFVSAMFVVYIVETQGGFVPGLLNWAGMNNTSSTKQNSSGPANKK